MVPAFASVFEVVPLNLTQWIITVAISLLPVPIIELQKKLDFNNNVVDKKDEKIKVIVHS